ncbi:Mediator of RNA polymerase II transcription subunit 33B [Zea mays]|uniref:Mediator of RNA polymerase II transcription subunit 33B n=1 Tax=Zea mays TaxID=4577 RepID=A0A1D6EGE4_MAIZE|nr:Mediator of RNA polymerase II transcription subunit 33B [Zea mays]
MPADKAPGLELKDALMVTPASSVEELEKLYSFAVSGSPEEKLAASKILCGASLLRGWNIQEHVVQMVLKLLSTFLPLDSGSEGRYVQHMPMLHALVSGISSIDTVHILSLYGLEFSVIANSPLRIDLSCVLDHVVSELTAFLRKVLAYSS